MLMDFFIVKETIDFKLVYLPKYIDWNLASAPASFQREYAFLNIL